MFNTTTLTQIDHEAPPEPPRLRALDLSEIARYEFKERAPLLMPWLHSQDLAMLFAGRGIGKTHLALTIAYAVATGGQCFGRWSAPQPGKVLYLDGELPGSVLQRRLLMHLPQREPAAGYLRSFTPDLLPDDVTLPDLSTRDGQRAIDEMLEPDTALVIVDNLSSWCRSGRENEAESWHPVADWILRLRRRGIAVLMVHHAGKGGQQRGTSKREDLLDVVISLNRPTDYDPKQGAVFNLEFSKARHLTGNDADSLELTLGGTEEAAVWSCRTLALGNFERIVELANMGLMQSEIASELGLHKSNVSRNLGKAREQGLVKLPPKEAL